MLVESTQLVGWPIDRSTASLVNLQQPNDLYICRTAPLTSRCCILYIYSTNTRTEYFKHAAHSPFFPLQNDVYFIMLPFLVPVLFTFYIQCVLKFKRKFRPLKLIKPTDALNSNFIGITTLHVSGSLSAHHQEFLAVHRLWYILYII